MTDKSGKKRESMVTSVSCRMSCQKMAQTRVYQRVKSESCHSLLLPLSSLDLSATMPSVLLDPGMRSIYTDDQLANVAQYMNMKGHRKSTR